MSDKQLPKALQLAEKVVSSWAHKPPEWAVQTAAELRRLHAELEQARAALAAQGEPVAWPLRAQVWKRESTQEWVLEIAGTLGDTDMNIRHTQPLSVAYENVPGLPTFYAQPAPAKPMDLEAAWAAWQVRASLPAPQQATPEPNPWRDAVEDELTILHASMPTDPREAVKKLVALECQIALDPDVSQQAAALVQRGRDEATPEPVGEPWGWAIEDKHGVAQAIRPARKEFFGCVQSTDPFTAEDIAKMDREWSGIAPHHVVTLYPRPAPGVPEVSIAEAVKESVAAIYFADSSDYKSALWSVVKALAPDLADMLETNGSAAYHQADARLAAAQAKGGA